ncbi:MAG: hypothetical protein WDM86_18310 [Rhizomicrobium sp.]
MRNLRPVGLMTAVAISTCLASAATAGDMSGHFGNTVLCKYANGDVTKVLVDSNGGFTVIPTGHPSSTGRWADDGTAVCFNQTNPPPGAGEKPVCYSSEARKVGDSWPITDPFGNSCTATLVSGRP